MTPCHRVLATVELLETILLDVDIQTIITSAQLVCKRWKLLVDRSQKIQQALFFVAVPQSHKKRRNPLLAKLFPPLFPLPGTSDAVFRIEDLQKLLLESADKRGAFFRQNASWRNMFIQQPPPFSLGYLDVYEGRMGTAYKRYIIPFDGGFRMNAFYDTIFRPLGNWRSDHSLKLLWWCRSVDNFRNSCYIEQESRLLIDAASESDVVLFTSEPIPAFADSIFEIMAFNPPTAIVQQLQYPYKDWDLNLPHPGLELVSEGFYDELDELDEPDESGESDVGRQIR
jgi:hypothetical protein